MECQSLFSGKNKNISKCGLLKFLPSMLSVNIEHCIGKNQKN